MSNRTLVKMTAKEHHILFRTVTPTQKSLHNFKIPRDTIIGLKDNEEIIKRYCGSFAALRRDASARTLSIHFTWLSRFGCQIKGQEEIITLSYNKLLDFMERSAEPGGPKSWTALSLKSREKPKLEFCEKESLHTALENPIVRHKLVKFLRDNFYWEVPDKICFYNDHTPYSFIFRAFRNGELWLFGGLTLCKQENMNKAYYLIHT